MTTLLLAIALTIPQATPAPDASTQTGSPKAAYASIKGFILRSADKMPADQFTFQPTPEVRSFGQVLAHITDANYLLCAPALGQPNPNGDVIQKTENEKLARAPLMAKLNESFAFCDKAYDTLTDANANDPLPLMSSNRPRLAMLWFHIAHGFEHYGNLVTYMRLKGIVPPSSERPAGR